MPKVLLEKIKAMEKLTDDIYRMTIGSETVAREAVPGQFVNVQCSGGLDAILRRPISICRVDKADSTFDIVFQIKGTGTEYLSKMMAGDTVDIIAPLGKPFQVPYTGQRIAVVGGGIGIFPLLHLLEEGKHEQSATFLGFRNKDFVVLEREFRRHTDLLSISTDDGSYGHQGLVTEQLEKELKKGITDIIYACGPMPMIKGVVRLADRYGVKCQVSLEQRMGCGFGACLVCACKTKAGDGWKYSHVCKDGPVFWSDEVIFDD